MPTNTADPLAVFCPTCGIIREGCVCELQKTHKPGCRFLRAASLSVELACEHGFQACPICDPCDCGAAVPLEGVR